MKKILLILTFLPVFGFSQNFFWSHNYSLDTIPTMYTNSASEIRDNSAILGGDILLDGGDDITEKGIVWSTSSFPTTADNKIVMGSGMGSFSQLVTGFTCGTTIYFRSYGINGVGTGYGPQNSFTLSSLNNTERYLFYSINSDCGSYTITSLATARQACADWNNILCDNKGVGGAQFRIKNIEVNAKVYSLTVDCASAVIANGYYLIPGLLVEDEISRIVYVQSSIITYLEECY